jgi:hypothetical protein
LLSGAAPLTATKRVFFCFGSVETFSEPAMIVILYQLMKALWWLLLIT